MTLCPNFVPDFFIVGAPKCGTTALYEYLKTHPSIFMPAVKEPTYFAQEFREGRSYIGNADAYADLYKKAEGQCTGDASPFYLISENAVEDILKCNPKAKFIALVRDPVAMFLSWHAQALRILIENEVDPEKAWKLQKKRQQSGAPLNLQYKKVCSLGTQIKKFVKKVPEEQQLIIMFDDLKGNPLSVYRRVLEFLQIEDDGRTEFPVVNVRVKLKSPAFKRVMRTVYYGLKFLKPAVNALGLRPFSKMKKMNETPIAQKDVISDEFRKKLLQEFEAEISLLEATLDKDLSEWRRL